MFDLVVAKKSKMLSFKLFSVTFVLLLCFSLFTGSIQNVGVVQAQGSQHVIAEHVDAVNQLSLTVLDNLWPAPESAFSVVFTGDGSFVTEAQLRIVQSYSDLYMVARVYLADSVTSAPFGSILTESVVVSVSVGNDGALLNFVFDYSIQVVDGEKYCLVFMVVAGDVAAGGLVFALDNPATEEFYYRLWDGYQWFDNGDYWVPFFSLYGEFLYASVSYDGNGASGGVAPVDPNSPYVLGSTVTVLGQGSLVKTGYSFLGWSHDSLTDTPSLVAGDTFVIYSDMPLFAIWLEDDKFAVVYDGNGNTGGVAPVDGNSPYYNGSSVTVLGRGSLVKTGLVFGGWSTTRQGTFLIPATPSVTSATSVAVIFGDTSSDVFKLKTNVFSLREDFLLDEIKVRLGRNHPSVTGDLCLSLYKASDDALVGTAYNTLSSLGSGIVADMSFFIDAVMLKDVDYYYTVEASNLGNFTSPLVTFHRCLPMYTVFTDNIFIDLGIELYKNGVKTSTEYGILPSFILVGNFEETIFPSVIYQKNDAFVITGNTVLYAVWTVDNDVSDAKGYVVVVQFVVLFVLCLFFSVLAIKNKSEGLNLIAAFSWLLTGIVNFLLSSDAVGWSISMLFILLGVVFVGNFLFTVFTRFFKSREEQWRSGPL